jgi:hypothetical protein
MELMYPTKLTKLKAAKAWVERKGVPKMDFRIYRSTSGLATTVLIFKQACRRLVRISNALDEDADEIME